MSPLIKAFFPPSVWSRREYIWALNWKKSLLIGFQSCQGIPYSHRHSGKRIVNTLLIVNITTTCKSLENKCILFTHFCFMQEKKKAPGLYLQQADNILALNVQLLCQKIDKKYRMAKWTTNFFFHRCSYKNSCFSELTYISSVLVLRSEASKMFSKMLL